MKRQTCGVGDDAVASLVSRTPDRDERRKSLFSFLRSRSTCQEASEKSGLGSPFQEKASACVGVSGRGSSHGELTCLLRGAHARAALSARKCSWGRKGREASQAFGIKVNKHFLWYLGLVSHLTSVATIQLHYRSQQVAVHNT